MLFRRFSVVALIIFTAVSAFTQVRSDLRGRILDPSGAAISNAHVELTEAERNLRRQTITDGSGEYSFSQLNPGTYRIEVSASGFQSLTRTGFAIAVGETASLDLTMQVGSEQRAITVDAESPALQSQTSDIQTNIPGSTVVAMPLNSRNFVNLTSLVPGVELPPGTLLPRINGGRPRTNEYLYDGISALQPEPGQVVYFPIIDDIQEFTVEANNVSAEFGRFNGGVVNVATRSGTNEVHSSAYEFLRNEDLNARNYFAPAGPKPEYRRNLYGGTFGAPIVKDKLFVFAGYQGIRQLIGVTRTSTVPTLDERNGIFTGVAHIYNPSTTQLVNGKVVRQEFANDVITTPLDPTAVALLSRIPLPTSNGTANNYTRVANDSDHENQLDLRLDGLLTHRDRAFGRYSFFNDVEQPATPFPDGSGSITGSVLGTGGVVGLSHVRGQQAVFSETHTFSDHLLNDFRAGYTWRVNSIAGPLVDGTASSVLGIPGIPTNAAFNNALPLFTFTGYQQIGASAGTNSRYRTGVWEIVDTLSNTRGRHTIKGGVDFRWYQLNALAPSNPTGSFAFTTTGTNLPGVATSGNAFASFLLGQVDTFSVDLQQSVMRPRDHIEEYFLQDDWRVTDRLTFNVGARWTLHFPSTEVDNQGAVFNLQTQQLDYLGKNGYSRSARELHYGNVAPRVGLAYMLTPKTVVRSGYGIVFIDQSGITTPFTTPQFPFIQTVQQKTQDSTNAAFQLSNGPTVQAIPLTPEAGLGQSVYTVNRNAGSGYVQQWNLAVQRQLTNTLSVEVAYVGSHIVHLGIPDSNLNQLTVQQLAQGSSLLTKVPNPYYGIIPASSSIGGKTVTEAQLLKPYPEYLNVATYRNNTGTSNYNAFEAKVEQRFTKGMYLLFSYTRSKLIDDASSVFSSTVLSSPNTSSLVAADTYNPRLERDLSSNDMPNVFSISGIYDLPAGRGHRFASQGIASKLLGGWTLNAISLLESGMPVTITQANNLNSFAGFVLQRPTLIGDPSLPSDQRSIKQWFNTSAFTTTPQFAIGNASRNPVRGPAYRNLDVALVKHTKVSEKIDMEFRGEIFNLTNTPALAQPNGSFGSPAFGTITSTTTDPRVVQFAIRFSM
ncbi:MAG TPA: TonB-dependent receptor [Candidatus Acidoferrales bacterium]|nr:TonB-dependent receptor [Candidatus Acidoferrales bacterium]